jgi:hypothetical protein
MKVYFECDRCGYARVEQQSEEFYIGRALDCPACGTPASLGVGKGWLRPRVLHIQWTSMPNYRSKTVLFRLGPRMRSLVHPSPIAAHPRSPGKGPVVLDIKCGQQSKGWFLQILALRIV